MRGGRAQIGRAALPAEEKGGPAAARTLGPLHQLRAAAALAAGCRASTTSSPAGSRRSRWKLPRMLVGRGQCRRAGCGRSASTVGFNRRTEPSAAASYPRRRAPFSTCSSCSVVVDRQIRLAAACWARSEAAGRLRPTPGWVWGADARVRARRNGLCMHVGARRGYRITRQSYVLTMCAPQPFEAVYASLCLFTSL